VTNVRVVFQLLGGIVGIAGLLALLAVGFYLLWRIAMIAVSFIPAIGKKHKHPEWERLQKRSPQPK
jgi:ABC-type lipoprotein release transport system permease subunit